MPFTLANATVAEQLKRDTESAHQRSEELLMPVLTRIASRSDYAAVLRTFYGFFQPVQELIAPHITNEILPDISQRRHASGILDDLAALGFDNTNLPLCTDLPPIADAAQALGALYVLEGSTLGGRMIAKMLLRNEALHLTGDGLRFFNGYGEDTGPKWKSLVAVLNEQADRAEPIIHSADETFTHLSRWIQKNHYHESNH